ncbi:MAG: hypothetical protein H0W84_13285 [Bacteroidetes bacterium]|nr:hypothetical protein [Bacteroidota bacterium]
MICYYYNKLKLEGNLGETGDWLKNYNSNLIVEGNYLKQVGLLKNYLYNTNSEVN